MKLKKVVVSFEYVIAVDEKSDYSEQITLAQRLVKQVVSDMGYRDFGVDVQDLKNDLTDLPPGWNDLCLPYGSDDEATIGEIRDRE
jgi:hypothetical protein